MLPFLPFCLQEYTTKLAALQGKGDDYEAAAAQVRPSSFEGCVSSACLSTPAQLVCLASSPMLTAPAWPPCRWALRSTLQ